MRDLNPMTPLPAILENRLAAPAPAIELTLDRAPVSVASQVAARFASLMLPEDSMVVDDRSHLTPAQMVENKLIHRLKASSLPVSHIQIRGMVRNRFEA